MEYFVLGFNLPDVISVSEFKLSRLDVNIMRSNFNFLAKHIHENKASWSLGLSPSKTLINPSNSFYVTCSTENFIEKVGLSGKRFGLKICKDFDSFNTLFARRIKPRYRSM